ncbi:MAG: hypothetical protein Q4P14_02260 [Methanobacteriaceae archaeon]|nr:hypothetical protein [Methanobacteriaceae archaeon]
MAILLVLCVGAVSAADADVANGVVLNDGPDLELNDTNSSITVSEFTKVDTNYDDVIIPVEVTDGNGTKLNVTKEDLNVILTYNETDSESSLIKNITDFTFENDTISFNIKDISKIISGEVLIDYKNECNATTNLVLFTSGISVQDTTDVNIDIYDVKIPIVIIDKDGNPITINKDDLKLVLDYKYTTDNVTENGTVNGTIDLNNTLNITDFSIENETILFNIVNIENITAGKVLISYKDDLNATTDLKFILECEIKVLTNESSTEYQNNYFVVELWDKVLNKTLEGKNLTFSLKGSSINFQFKTDKNGRVNVSGDYLNMFSGGNLPIGTGYEIIVSSGNDIIAKAQNITFNISAVKAKFSAKDYTSTYGSGVKWTVNLKNTNSGTSISDLATLRVYTNKKCTSKYLIGSFSVYTGTEIGMNLGPGTYYIKVYDGSSNYVASAYGPRKVVIKAVTAKISASAVTAYYKGNNTFKVKMVNKANGKALKGASVLLNIYTGSKFKSVQLTTDDKGYAYWTVSGISFAKHKVLVGSNVVSANIVTTSITYKKGKITISAPKVTNKCGLNQYLTIKATKTAEKTPLSNAKLTVKVYNSKGKLVKTFSATTDKNGTAKVNTKTLVAGTYKVIISYSSKYYAASKTIANDIVMQKQKTVVDAPTVTNICGEKAYFKIGVTKADGGNVISGITLTLKLYNSKGKLVKTYSVKTNANGVASLNTKSLAKGTYKVVISSSNQYYAVSKTVTKAIVMTKYPTVVNADPITAKYKKNGYFKVNITKDDNITPIDKLSVVVKVYKGSKLVKTYTTTTNADGIATINTKALAKGTYKAVISTNNVSYAVSKTIDKAIKIA